MISAVIVGESSSSWSMCSSIDKICDLFIIFWVLLKRCCYFMSLSSIFCSSFFTTIDLDADVFDVFDRLSEAEVEAIDDDTINNLMNRVKAVSEMLVSWSCDTIFFSNSIDYLNHRFLEIITRKVNIVNSDLRVFVKYFLPQGEWTIRIVFWIITTFVK